MLRSLRFQLPAFFLLGAVVAGLVSAVIALRLFRGYARTRPGGRRTASWRARQAGSRSYMHARPG